MSNDLGSHYDDVFYKKQIDGSVRSAMAVLGHLFKYYTPTSMLDIGCGRGAWLASAERLGVETLHGLDGSWVKSDELMSSNIIYSPVDMEESIVINMKYDLAISVEVAEHLTEKAARKFVEALCAASDVVLFSAAVKCQGGENHVNEQRQSYWVALFAENGYRCIDFIRPLVWNNSEVCPWYRQNTLIYVNQTREDLVDIFGKSADEPLIDVIHPEMFENRVLSYRKREGDPTFRYCVGIMKSFLLSKIGWRRKSGRFG